MENTATLTSKGNYTTFSFNGEKIWFYTSPALVRYNRVKKWHKGYIEVMADYGQGEEEDYIDLGASFAAISAQLDRIVAEYFGAKKCA